MIYPRDGQRPFALAGIWDEWCDPSSGELLRSFAVLTTVSNPLTQAIGHHRAPVILDPDREREWLDPDTPLGDITTMLRTWDAKRFNAYPISPAIRDPRRNGSGLLEPVGQRVWPEFTHEIHSTLEVFGMGELSREAGGRPRRRTPRAEEGRWRKNPWRPGGTKDPCSIDVPCTSTRTAVSACATAPSVDELIDRAQAGVTRLALTDIGTTSANWDFVRRAKERASSPCWGWTRNGRDRKPALARHPEGYAAVPLGVEHHLSHTYPRGCRRGPAGGRGRRVPGRHHARRQVGTRRVDRVSVTPSVRLAGVRDACERRLAQSTTTFTCKRDWNAHRLLRAIDHNTLLSR